MKDEKISTNELVVRCKMFGKKPIMASINTLISYDLESDPNVYYHSF